MARESVRRAPVTLPEESAPQGWLRSMRLSGFTVLMLALVVFAIAVLAPNLKILIEQQQQLAELRASVAQAEQSVAELTEQEARWSDPAYIEAQARERLYYAYPGDISYLVVGEAGRPTTRDGQPISASVQTTKVDWAATLLSSILTAGLTDAPPSELPPAPGTSP